MCIIVILYCNINCILDYTINYNKYCNDKLCLCEISVHHILVSHNPNTVFSSFVVTFVYFLNISSIHRQHISSCNIWWGVLRFEVWSNFLIFSQSILYSTPDLEKKFLITWIFWDLSWIAGLHNFLPNNNCLLTNDDRLFCALII